MGNILRFQLAATFLIIAASVQAQTRSYCAYDIYGSKYELNLREGEGSLTYKKYSSGGSLLQTLFGTWEMRDEGVYGSAYKVVASISGNTMKWLIIRDGSGGVQELRDESSNRQWSPCTSNSYESNTNTPEPVRSTTGSVTGRVIKLGNLQVAQFDFPNKMNWTEAKQICATLGKGWRLPTKTELNLLYKNAAKLGEVSEDGYWTSTENGTERAWRQYLTSGGQYTDVKYGSGYVRAVRIQ